VPGTNINFSCSLWQNTKQKALLLQGLLREEEKKGGNWVSIWCTMQLV
jgi:hypothetical protein